MGRTRKPKSDVAYFEIKKLVANILRHPGPIPWQLLSQEFSDQFAVQAVLLKRGNISKAAQKLDAGRTMLSERLKTLGKTEWAKHLRRKDIHMKFSPTLKTTLQNMDAALDQVVALIPQTLDITLISDQSQYTADDIAAANTQISMMREQFFSAISSISSQLKQFIPTLDV